MSSTHFLIWARLAQRGLAPVSSAWFIPRCIQDERRSFASTLPIWSSLFLFSSRVAATAAAATTARDEDDLFPRPVTPITKSDLLTSIHYTHTHWESERDEVQYCYSGVIKHCLYWLVRAVALLLKRAWNQAPRHAPRWNFYWRSWNIPIFIFGWAKESVKGNIYAGR